MTGKRTYTILLFILITACEERITVSLKSEHTDLIVVEGILTNEKTRHRVQLSHPYPESNGTVNPVSGAVVTVTGASQTYNLTESPVGSGSYLTDSMIAVVATPYQLTIQYQGKEYSAQDSAEPVEPLPPIDYQPTDIPQFYRLTPDKSGSTPNYVDNVITWENTGFCIAGEECGGEIIFYDLKTTDVNEIYKPAKADFYFPAGTTIIRRKYSASPAYKSFLRAVLSETEWRGGVFDVERDNAPTNLSEGAIGFFAVSTVVADTTVVDQ